MAEICDDFAESIDENLDYDDDDHGDDGGGVLFDKAAGHLPQVLAKVTVSDENLLYLYARFKQATEGPCNTSRPGLFEFQAKKKWDSWNTIKNMPREQARTEYVAKIKLLDPEWTPEKHKSPSSKASWVSVSSMATTEEDLLPDNQKTAFDWCKDGKLEPMRKCMNEKKVDSNSSDDEGMTLLHWACDRGHPDIVRYLIQNEANINQTDSEGQTALHYACACGHADIARLLLENKADLTIQDSEGETALQMSDNDEVKNLLSTWAS